MDKKIINTEMQPVSGKLVIVQGVIQNLPEILGTIKEIYTLNKKEKLFSGVLQSRLDELNINKENFKVLVEGLTDLSKSDDTDDETKVMYRDMIKTLFGIFTTNMHNSQDISNFLKEFWKLYGINLLEVAKILGTTAVSNILFNKYGAIRSIHQEIIKYSAQQNITMVKVMIRTLAQQNDQAYRDVVKILDEHFTKEELQEILTQWYYELHTRCEI